MVVSNLLKRHMDAMPGLALRLIDARVMGDGNVTGCSSGLSLEYINTMVAMFNAIVVFEVEQMP
eukprot:scaffold399548_cov16-Prasinocladus_malaysianus.AAC.1